MSAAGADGADSGNGRDAEDSARAVFALLAERGETLAVAESLTGGALAAQLTAAAGASKVFRGSVTSYATAVKRELLGVDGKLLRDRGAVDPEVARQMAAGVRSILHADWSVSTTGVAGPEPQDGHPVGTVFAAVAGPEGPVVAAQLRVDEGLGREAIRMLSVRGGLELLHSRLVANTTGATGNRPGGMDVCSPE